MSVLSRLRWHYRQQGGIRNAMSAALSDPSEVLSIFVDDPSHFYHLEFPVFREDVLTFVRPLVDASDDRVLETWREIRADDEFAEDVGRELARTDARPDQVHSNWRELLYTLVRLRNPTTIVETGVFDGLSSAYILRALERNGAGQLVSIDVNDPERLPPDLDGGEAGWLVPPGLADRWDCRFGDSRELLPTVAEGRTIDLFLHDSLHTAEHMRFEFRTVLPAMDTDSVLVSDNVRFNNEFWTVAENRLHNPVFWKNTRYGETYEGDVVDDRLGAGLVEPSNHSD